jgi:hypothetical protein
VLTLIAVSGGWLDDVGSTAARKAVGRAIERARAELTSVVDRLDAGMVPEGDWTSSFKTDIDEALKGLTA